MPKQIILLATSDAQSNRSADLERLISSVENFLRESHSVSVKLYLLIQRGNVDIKMNDVREHFITIFSSPSLVPSSVARNKLLEAARDNLTDDAIVAFPDDDCWYPDRLLAHIVSQFEDPNVEFWFSRYASPPQPLESYGTPKEVPAKLQQAISRGACNTIFIRGDLVKRVGYFDERLGIGSDIKGGEDTDYSIRSFYAAKLSLFLDAPVVGHRNADRSIVAKYFPGSFVVISQHALRSWPGLVALVRKLAIGILLSATRKMSARDLFTSIRLASINNVPRYPRNRL